MNKPRRSYMPPTVLDEEYIIVDFNFYDQMIKPKLKAEEIEYLNNKRLREVPPHYAFITNTGTARKLFGQFLRDPNVDVRKSKRSENYDKRPDSF